MNEVTHFLLLATFILNFSYYSIKRLTQLGQNVVIYIKTLM